MGARRPAPASVTANARPSAIRSRIPVLGRRNSLLPASPLRQLALQFAAVFLVLSLAWPYYGMRGEAMPWLHTALVIGGVAFGLASLTRQPFWWRLIHAGFMPLAWAVTQFNIDPGWFLLAFILMLLVYRGAVTEQVPLYLSNAATVAALARLVGGRRPLRFVDLGAGVGSTVRPLAERCPGGHFTGVENAPLTWAIGRLRTYGRPNLDWRWGDLWQTDLGQFDVVYAFLSPAPMADLWEKAKAEMKPGGLLVSNSFPVPEVEAQHVVEVDCTPPRTLYCYRL